MNGMETAERIRTFDENLLIVFVTGYQDYVFDGYRVGALDYVIKPVWTTVVLSRQRKLEQQSMYAEMNQRYYESMEQQHFEIRRMRHDMVNHLQTLSVLPEKEKEEYIQNLLDNTVNIRNSHYCGDSTINAVLTVKAAAMEELEIEFSYKLDIPTELALNKMDICALFANTLDNAIACRYCYMLYCVMRVSFPYFFPY